MTTPSPEALALAREQLDTELLARETSPFWDERCIRERATVIELRRQLAEKDEDFEEGARERDSLRTELATERQRLEESESDRRTQYCRADAAERLLATERQRAEAASFLLYAARDAFAAGGSAEGLECRGGGDVPAFARWYVAQLAASEAKRKALREALLDVGQIVIQMRIPTVEESAAGHERALREKGEVHTIWTKALAADGKDTTPEETSMRGVRDDSEHYT